ncbi:MULTISPECIES: ATP-binding protein [unclassified Mesorhizobium]|uniref:ATP-binding protein n=1 Tax=unclassified Mesorhizobium TaxID=325217 RepID=UPI000FDC4574|nr:MULTISPECIES: ATP-binding protein [unclassified Mesorhizobium]TGR23081.1 HAMP domain-containing protein [Mesorhizobium sp. M8A.F.Ca.ET.197.01.1.1]TGR39167.1 HAMP domain-containing protein [bacterium M00.F.Ca.ET.199.01.1.1]TGR46761.1 HAMP domain-containing protein [Mesorhizobium sp. M8A.F.Ca.ET.198.01.1.1]TGV85164.1 HAMP domain-containing protein [Mesorhizobium sp. M00.F.Ca.ET.149.01.1.1]
MTALLSRSYWWEVLAWWKKSLTGQFIAVMLLALIAAQALTMLVTWDDQRKQTREFYNTEFLNRVAAITDVLKSKPASVGPDVLVAGGTYFTRLWVSPSAPADATSWGREAIAHVNNPLRKIINADGREIALALYGPVERFGAANRVDGNELLRELKLDPALFPANAQFFRFSDANGIGLALPLGDGNWLNAGYYKPFASDFWRTQTFVSIALTVAVLCFIAVLTAGRIARPLRQLARSADALGRGETSELLPERGPDEIRQTHEAFNRMQARLTRFLTDRTRMLAAISHDLRTPITTLRLRAEYIADEGLKQKMLNTLAEMQSMTEATLSFAKEEASVEKTRTVDLCSLVESVCEDQVELGRDVVCEDCERLVYRCRPDALRRALRNIIENAVRYAGRASVALSSAEESVKITVSDDGPGIPKDQREQVFSPFFRLEQSRNRHTGGIGLGLAIARAIIRHHGGDIVLGSNDPGLVVSIVLPYQPTLAAKPDRPRFTASLRGFSKGRMPGPVEPTTS